MLQQRETLSRGLKEQLNETGNVGDACTKRH